MVVIGLKLIINIGTPMTPLSPPLWVTAQLSQDMLGHRAHLVKALLLWPTLVTDTLGHRKTWQGNAGPQSHMVKYLYLWRCMLGYLCFVAALAGPLKKIEVEAQHRVYMNKSCYHTLIAYLFIL